MTSIFKCRRTVTALFTITAIALLGAYLKVDTSGAAAMVAIALAGSNAAQAVFVAKKEGGK